MKLSVTTSHTVQFSVEAFWSEEGGMGHDSYGTPQNTLEEAIRLLDLVRSKDDKTPWVIVAHVTTSTK